MQNECAIEVEAADKLRWLRRLDGAREWEPLDDRRSCRCCGKTFSGLQVQLVGGKRMHGAMRFVCPTPNCLSTPPDWLHPHESGVAAKLALRFRRPHVVRVKHARHVLGRSKQRATWTWKLRHTLQRHLGLPI